LEEFLVENSGRESIFIGAGANMDHPAYGPPRETLKAAMSALQGRGVRIVRLSPWYRTAPVPASAQPWYINVVAEVATDLTADALLAELHAVETVFGRVRTVPNAPRAIDLDLLDFHGEMAPGGPGRATLPHPRMAGRAFVLRPLADLAPEWRHPVTGVPLRSLLKALPADQIIERI
jgi:2-amino-4-hydroxy-6-hydroxymethyldihydropteridine diphosphokinase